MDGIREVLETIRRYNLAPRRLRGVFHIAIGRRIAKPDGTVLSQGITWRQLAAELKAARFDKDLVSELGIDPDTLSPRDRERFWYSAIGLAKVDSLEARQQADALTVLLLPLGFVVGPVPGASSELPTRPKKK